MLGQTVGQMPSRKLPTKRPSAIPRMSIKPGRKPQPTNRATHQYPHSRCTVLQRPGHPTLQVCLLGCAMVAALPNPRTKNNPLAGRGRCQFNFIVIPLYCQGIRASRGDRTPVDSPGWQLAPGRLNSPLHCLPERSRYADTKPEDPPE